MGKHINTRIRPAPTPPEPDPLPEVGRYEEGDEFDEWQAATDIAALVEQYDLKAVMDGETLVIEYPSRYLAEDEGLAEMIEYNREAAERFFLGRLLR